MHMQFCLPHRVSVHSFSLYACDICIAHQQYLKLFLPRIRATNSKHQDAKTSFKAAKMAEKESNKRKQEKRAEATAWLAQATGARTLTTNASFAQLQDQRKQGKIAASTKDEELKKHAQKKGHHAAALSVLRNPLSGTARQQMEALVENVEHPKGATHTDKHGDMRTHGAGGAKKAMQRAANTNLTNASSLHHHPSAASEYSVFVSACSSKDILMI